MTTPRRCGGFAALVLVLVSAATDVVPVAGQTTRAIERGSRVRSTAPSLGLREAIGTIRFAVPWVQVGLILGVTYVFSLLATFLPARQASRIYPADALRYE